MTEDRAAYERALRFLDRQVSRAIWEFGLFRDGDRVMVALSGGKDSLTLLNVLARRREWRRERYDLLACHIRGGLGCSGTCASTHRLEEACAALDVRLRIVEGAMPSFEDVRDNKSPCFVCSWHRRKALFEVADEEGYPIVALGHHKDDMAETLLLNLLWRGEHGTMLPRQPLFEGRITLIRPLALVDQKDIVRVARLGNLPVRPCACRFGQESRREVVRKLVRQLREEGCRDVTSNLVRSVLSSWDPASSGHPARNRDRGAPPPPETSRRVSRSR